MPCYGREILSRYQDGSLSDADSRRIAAHLDGCEPCCETLRSLGRAGLMLRVTVGSHRSEECLAEEEIGAYLAGAMKPEDRERIELHLSKCNRCLHEVAVMSDDSIFAPDAGENAPGDGVFAPPEPAFAPSPKAFARFLAIGRPEKKTRLATRPWRYVAAAAALVIATFAGGGFALIHHNDATSPAGAAATVAASGMPRLLRYVTDVSFDSTDSLFAPSGSAELTRFAREAGTLLREVERVNEGPRREAFELLQDDILNSGLVESVARLRESTREERDRHFLNDCEYVLMQVVKSDGRDLDSPVGDLARIVAEIRRLKLSETARLVEMEGSRSQWLAGL